MAEINPQSLREWREERGLTQKQVADLLGVSQTSVCHWETGQQVPAGSASTLWRLLLGGFVGGVVYQALLEAFPAEKGDKAA